MERYNSPSQEVERILPLPGNSGTTPLVTPATATGTGVTTRVTTLDGIGFGIPVIIKKLVYTISRAATGAGDTTRIVLYKGTSAVGTLNCTNEVALTVKKSSSDINSTLAATDYIRTQVQSIATASDDVLAAGFLAVTYVEQFT